MIGQCIPYQVCMMTTHLLDPSSVDSGDDDNGEGVNVKVGR